MSTCKEQKIFWLLFFLIIADSLSGQVPDTSWISHYKAIEKNIRVIEKTIPGLDEIITNSVSGVTIDELLRAIAISSGVNMSIDPKLNFQVVNNFKDVKVSDILLFLCKEYKLDITAIGNIIIIKQIESPKIPNRCEVKYDPQMNCLSLDIEDVELGFITQQITDVTKHNVIPGNGLYDHKIKIYIQDLSIPEALKMVAYSNNLSLDSTENGIYFFEKAPEKKNETIQQKATKENSINSDNIKTTLSLSVKSIGKDSLYVYAINTPITDVIEEVSAKSGNDYIMTSSPEGEVTLHLSCARYEDVLSAILSDTDHAFKKKGEIYLIGNKRSPDLMTQTFVQLQYRTVDKGIRD